MAGRGLRPRFLSSSCCRSGWPTTSTLSDQPASQPARHEARHAMHDRFSCRPHAAADWQGRLSSHPPDSIVTTGRAAGFLLDLVFVVLLLAALAVGTGLAPAPHPASTTEAGHSSSRSLPNQS